MHFTANASSRAIGKLLIDIGFFALAAGLAMTYAPGLLGWFGKLPGDIRIETKHSFIFIPITSMLVISIILTVIINLFFRR